MLLSPGNDAAEAWGLRLYRSTLYAFCAALDADGGLPGDDVRPLVHQVMDAFWCHPTQAEARAWGAYPYDSDPAGTAVRPLARPFTAQDSAHSRRPCMACGITRPEHTRGPGRVSCATLRLTNSLALPRRTYALCGGGAHRGADRRPVTRLGGFIRRMGWPGGGRCTALLWLPPTGAVAWGGGR